MTKNESIPTKDDSERKPSRIGSLVGRWLLLAFPLCFFLWTGELGIDFGRHWDEGHRITDISKAARTQTLLPDAYNYPSVSFELGMYAFLPKFAEAFDLGGGTEEYDKEVTNYLQSREFMLRLRRHFLILSSAALAWVFAAMLALGRRPLEGLFAAAFLMGSFELLYHARWAAPDAIMMQFVAFSLVAIIKAYREPDDFRWVILAAIGTGLAAGTKYLGVALTIPLVLLLLFRGLRLKSLLCVALVCLVTFLVTTPGALLQPTHFVEDLLFEQDHYKSGHDGFTVEVGLDHLSRNLRYILVYAPSTHLWISILFGVLGLVGVIAMWRESTQLAIVLLSLPVLYIIAISLQRVMFVRNLLVLMPFAAILSARGLGALWDLMPWTALRWALGGVVAAAVGINADSLLKSAESIDDYRPEVQFAQVYEYLSENPEHTYRLSPLVYHRLVKFGYEPLPNTVYKKVLETEAEFVVAEQSELRARMYWPSNDPELMVRAFGPASVNYSYYSTWPQSLIVVLERQKALEIAAFAPLPGIEKIFKELGPQQETSKGQRGQKKDKRRLQGEETAEDP